MNIKERLKNSNKPNLAKKNNKIINKYKNVQEFFCDEKYVKNLLNSYIKNSRNIIYVVDNSFDCELISLYLKSFIQKSDKDKSFKNNIEIISEPSIFEIVKIFEKYITVGTSYIFGLKLKNPDKIYDKLSALIAINFGNLQQNNIDILIKSSELVFIYFSKNEEGVYFISGIEELVYSDGKTSMEKIYNSASSYILSSEENIKEQQEENKQEPPLIIVNNTKPKKVNKYKLLKEKIRSKRENSKI